MHAAKGLEFSAVVVMACDDTVIPSMVRIESVGNKGTSCGRLDSPEMLIWADNRATLIQATTYFIAFL
jgi:superfamily I DNA/RNA helicase